MNDYHLGFELNDSGCYAPIQLLSAIFNKGMPTGVMYNGVDIYDVSACGYVEYGGYKSFYANTDRFMVDENHEAIMGTPASDEAYRFTYSDTNDNVTTYYTISLKKDGGGGLYMSNDESTLGEIKSENDKLFYNMKAHEGKRLDVTCQYKWYETEEGIFIDPYYDSGNEEENVSINNEEDLIKIPKTESYYGTRVRSKEAAELNFNLLAFTFEKCYGLTEDKFPNGFYKEIDARNLKEGLLATDSLEYDEALLELTTNVIDDGHTAYMHRSIYSGYMQEDMSELRKAHRGERVTALLNYEDEYKLLRTQTMSKLDSKYEDKTLQQGLFIEGSTAVIRFDVFEIGRGLQISDTPAEDGDISEKIVFDTADSVELAFREIAKNKNIKNVVFDLTCNTGGTLPCAPYLLGYMTDDPELMLYSSARDLGADLHYKADTNRDGVFDEKDVLADRYQFYIMTSEVSFSCANTLPAMAKNKGIPIIGHKSSGGACERIEYKDACGSEFYSSQEMMMGTFNDEGKFTNCDGGVEPDYKLDPENWYDLTKLNQFIESLNNK